MTQTRPSATRLSALALAAALALAPVAGLAQNLFAPAIKVGDRVITEFELQQRARMLQVLNAPGDLVDLAQTQLIEDRLKQTVADQFEIELEEGELAEGRREFASRANLSPEEFVQALAGAGVDETTFNDFIRVGLLWRKVVRGRFGQRVDVSDRDIDRAMTTAGNGDNLRVLLSEIFIAAPPQQAQQAAQLASQISQIRSFDAFAAAARQYSAAPSGQQGGRVNWTPLSELPPPIQQIMLDLEPGEVSQPLNIPGAIALFQLRALEEGEFTPRTTTAIDYAAYYIPGGRSEAALQQAANLRARIDTCDDLYGEAQGQPASVLDRGSKPVGQIPQDVAYELAKLDANEVSTTLTRSNGQTLVFLMLCKREQAYAAELDRDTVRNQLQNQQIDRYSKSYLEQLRSETRITVY